MAGQERWAVTWGELWGEAGGALGDLGTFVPLLVGLAVHNGLNVGTTLLFTGAYNIVTGLTFRLPMPVQPMKSVAAIAMAEATALSVPQIMAAGICVGSAVLLLGATGLIKVANWLVPRSVVCGLQVGVGVNLAKKGFAMMVYKDDAATELRPWWGDDSLALAAFGFTFLSFFLSASLKEASQPESGPAAAAEMSPGCRRASAKTFPAALVVLLVGLANTMYCDPAIVGTLRLGPSPVRIVAITPHDWLTGFTRAAVPQLPLTTLNSVVAVCALSRDLFPEKAASTTRVAVSVGVMNLVGCWFGALPVCHGSGGLAAQHLFGARSGLAVVLLGALKMLLGVAFGESLLTLLQAFPRSLLGCMLALSGAELASAGRRETTHAGCIVVFTTAAMGMALSSTAWGFLAGMWVAAVFGVRAR